MPPQLVSLFFAFAIFGLFLLLSVLFFQKTPNKKINYALSFAFTIPIFTISIYYYLNYAIILEKEELLRYYIPIDFTLSMFVGPSLYYHLRLSINKPIAITKSVILRAILWITPSIIYIIYFISFPTEVRLQMLNHNFLHSCWQQNVLNAFFYLQLCGYLGLCMYVIKKQIQKSPVVVIENIQSNISWLYAIYRNTILLMIGSIPFVFIINNDRINTLIYISIIITQYVYLFYQSMSHSPIIIGTTTPASTPRKHNTTKSQSKEETDAFLEKLKCCLKESHIHLQPGCSIANVANEMGIPAYTLSSLISEHTDKNFRDLLNEYRIEEAKKLIRDEDNMLSIEGIGQACGFKSKSTFNTAFKKFTGQTPSEYRQQKNENTTH